MLPIIRLLRNRIADLSLEEIPLFSKAAVGVQLQAASYHLMMARWLLQSAQVKGETEREEQ